MSTLAIDRPTEAEAEAPQPRRWHAPVLAMENTRTGDGRVFKSATWRQLPLALMWQEENIGGHDGSVIVARIDRIVRNGHTLEAWGTWSSTEPAAQRVIDMLTDPDGAMPLGVSIDAGVRGEVQVDEESQTITFEEVEIMGATIVPFPAFAEANRIEMWDDELPADDGLTAAATWDIEPPEVEGIGLVAAAAPVPATTAPPAAWFQAPKVDRREFLHIEADGRVWGHIYGWGECHTGSPLGQCVQPPPSATDYAYFLTGSVLCADGTTVRTGPIVLAADHAAVKGMSWLRAKDHYANTALAGADVAVGEDSFGIWVAGMLRPGTSPEIAHAVRASAPSGDWRPVGGGLELIAILSVNTPGYPALTASFDDDGNVEALIASGGRIDGADCGCGGHSALDAALARLSALEAVIQTVAGDAREHLAAKLLGEIGYDPEAHVAALMAEISD